MAELIDIAKLELKKVVGIFLTHPFFDSLSTNGFTQESLAATTEQYWSLTESFVSILCVAISSLPSDSARLPLVKNLWDEHGEGDIKRGHRILYQDFVDGVERSLKSREKTLKIKNSNLHTDLYLSGMKSLCATSNSSAIVGIMAFCEAIASYQCNAILKALIEFDKNEFAIGNSSSEFWVEHVEHEPVHVREVLEIIDQLELFDLEQFIRGATQSMMLEKVFWQGVLEEYQ